MLLCYIVQYQIQLLNYILNRNNLTAAEPAQTF